jgi:GWxTD domain-containing protein
MKSFRQSALTTLILGVATAAFADEREDRLSDEHRKWLKEDVVYIITEQEKDVFLSLETEEQRNLLIDAFWEKRDPYPATLENEFKTEHYRRIEHANKYLSRDAPMPGWRTDRGKYYIILGEPLSVQRFDGLSDVVSSEIWFYNGDPQLGLPSRFNLLFFRDHDVGHYELYDPINHGPMRLLRAGPSVMPDPNQALDVLELVSIDLAIASVTVDLTEMGPNVLRASRDPNSRFFRPSMLNNFRLLALPGACRRRVFVPVRTQPFFRHSAAGPRQHAFRSLHHRDRSREFQRGRGR